MRIKEQIFPFVNKYSRLDGEGSWKKNPLSVGVKKLNEYVSSVRTIYKSGTKTLIITTSYPDAVKSIVSKNISFSNTPSVSIDGKDKLKYKFSTSSGISNSEWFLKTLLQGGKYELTSAYTAKNDAGAVVAFQGKQEYKMSDYDRMQAERELQNLTDDKEDPDQYDDDSLLDRISELLGTGDSDNDSEEEKKDSGFNWMLVAGLIAVVVIIYLIIKK